MRHGLDEIVLAAPVPPIRFFRFLSPFYWGSKPPRGCASAARSWDLRPIYVKFGQILSTRRDLLPDDIAIELAKLQDQVPPFPASAPSRSSRRRWANRSRELFAAFETQPRWPRPRSRRCTRRPCTTAARSWSGGAAGYPEDHPARHRPAVHDRPPGAQVFTRRTAAAPVEVVEEYDKTIHDELDLLREAANCTQLRRNFSDGGLLYVPEIFWDLTRENVMVQERIYGIPVDQVDELVAAGVDMKTLGERGVGSSSPRCSATISSTPTCTRATSSCARTAPTSASTSASWAP